MHDEQERQQAILIERLNRQIETIEQTITTLMEDIDFSELSDAQRLDFTIKLMNQHTRALQLHQHWEKADPRHRERQLIVTLMRKMRGEEEAEDGTHAYNHTIGSGFSSDSSSLA